jgi:hypothetical protein
MDRRTPDRLRVCNYRAFDYTSEVTDAALYRQLRALHVVGRMNTRIDYAGDDYSIEDATTTDRGVQPTTPNSPSFRDALGLPASIRVHRAPYAPFAWRRRTPYSPSFGDAEGVITAPGQNGAIRADQLCLGLLPRTRDSPKVLGEEQRRGMPTAAAL